MRRIFKAVANAISLVLVMPAVALYGVGALMFGRDRAFPGWSQAFSLLPGFIGVYLRRAFYRVVLRHCDAEACISFGTVFSHSTARIGRKVYIGVYCSLGDITLEDDVLIASHVSIVNGGSQHGIGRLDRPVREQTGSWTHITIGQDSWIGDRAVVMADVGAPLYHWCRCRRHESYS